MYDCLLRIASALRLGLPVSNEYTCICGSIADACGSHALSCNKKAGRHARHSAVNIIIIIICCVYSTLNDTPTAIGWPIGCKSTL